MVLAITKEKSLDIRGVTDKLAAIIGKDRRQKLVPAKAGDRSHRPAVAG